MASEDDANRPGRPEDPPREDPVFAEALGRAIKVIRTGLDLGRPQLAERAGLSYSYLAEIENGKKQASSSAQQAIAKALGITGSELLAAAEEWMGRLRGEVAEIREEREPIVRASDSVLRRTLAYESRDEPVAPLGARARQLRWFRESATQRAWDGADLETVGSVGARLRRGPGAQAKSTAPDDEELEGVLLRLRELLEGLSPEDRERVLDLAGRLGEK
jgi:transcriptional regulator with XRE-family HTH domain